MSALGRPRVYQPISGRDSRDYGELSMKLGRPYIPTTTGSVSGVFQHATPKTPALRWRTGNWQPLWLPLSVMGALAVVASFLPAHGYDLYAYWQVDPTAPYVDWASEFGRFNYSPPVVLLFAPLRVFPWEVIVAGWLAAQLACLYYIGGRWFLVLVLFPPVWLDMVYGNINVMLATAVVASFRHPQAWIWPLFTKVTPGVGVLWLVGRRDWRGLAILTIVAFVIFGSSLLLQGPQIWADWIASIAASSRMPIPSDAWGVPPLPRIVLAAVLVLWGGWTDRRWTVPVAVTLAMPVLWPIALTPLVALSNRHQAEDDVLVAAGEVA